MIPGFGRSELVIISPDWSDSTRHTAFLRVHREGIAPQGQGGAGGNSTACGGVGSSYVGRWDDDGSGLLMLMVIKCYQWLLMVVDDDDDDDDDGETIIL